MKIETAYNLMHPRTKLELINILNSFCECFESYDVDCNWIHTERISDFSNLFESMPGFNGDITKWDVSNVDNLSGCFKNCEWFDQDLSGWQINPNRFNKRDQYLDVFKNTGRKSSKGFKLPDWNKDIINRIK